MSGGAARIEDLARQVAAAELTQAEAVAIAASTEVTGTLTPGDIDACAAQAMGHGGDGDFQRAAGLFELLLAALDQMDGADWALTRARATGAWIDCAGLACNVLPDGRWHSDAARRGEALLADHGAAVPDDLKGAVLHSLGVLYLDPYVAGRSSQNIDTQLRVWRERLRAEYGALTAQDPKYEMPDLPQALEIATDYFRRALPLRAGVRRGYTLKALAEALVWREITGGPADRTAAKAAATEAMALIAAQQDPEKISSLRNLLTFLGSPPKAAAPRGSWDELLVQSPADVVAELGEVAALERYIWAVRSAGPEPEKAVAIVGHVWSILTEARHEGYKSQLAQDLGQALANWAKAEGFVPILASRVEAKAKAMRDAARKQGWPEARLSGLLMGLAASTTTRNTEALGLPCAREALVMASNAQAPWAEVFGLLEASLFVGAAVNALNARKILQAVERYGDALGSYARLQLSDLSLEILTRLEDLVFSATEQEVVRLVIYLAQYGPLLQAQERPGVEERLQYLWRKAFGHCLTGGSVNPEVTAILFQAAKGAVFALAANRRAASNWRTDPIATEILAAIQAQRALGGAEAAPDAQLDDETLLCGFATRIATTATGPAAAAARLEQRFDGRVRFQVARSADPLETLANAGQLQSWLGPDTVMLTHYLATAQDGQTALYTQMTTSEDAFLTAALIGFPSSNVTMTANDREVSIHPHGLVIARLRTAIVQHPGPADVSRTAEDILVSDLALFGGGLMERLKALRAQGKTHLCFHPHGAFHFHPLHLIGGEGGCLADDWTLSKIAHPALLARRAAPRAGGPPRLAAFGLSFEGGQPHGLSPLPAVHAEVTAIGDLMASEVFLDDAATEAQFVEALRTATFIHIASHGSQRVGAAAFQKVFLWPGAGGDGLFHAYEALGLDLSHVALITLSACETALGQFDAGDNLRGLTANLMASGVQAIISTLWRVPDEVARTFFVVLYGQIAQGVPKLAAFRAAQVQTRSVYPQFRDWGAFDYSGIW